MNLDTLVTVFILSAILAVISLAVAQITMLGLGCQI